MFCDRLRYGVALPALPPQPWALPRVVLGAGGARLSAGYSSWQREAGSPSSSVSVPELPYPSGCHMSAGIGRAEGVQNPPALWEAARNPPILG